MQLLNLPAYQAPNALDFSPMTQAIQSGQQNALAQQRLGMEQQRVDMEGSRLDMTRRQFEFQQRKAKIEELGNLAMVADGERDPAKRQMLMSQILAQHPDAASLPPMYRDPIMGPRLIRAEAGKARDELAEAAARAGISLHQAQAEKARAEAKAAGQKDELTGFIVNSLRGISAPTGAPSSLPQTQPQGGFQPQSFETPSPMPGVVLTGAGDQPQAAPNDPMIDTPLGRMPAAKAKALGFAFALAGKGDAGKMLSEAGDQGKLGKEATNENDKAELGFTNQMARLNQIRSSFNEDYLKGQTQVGMWGRQLVSKWGKLPPKDQEQLYKYATFRRDAIENLNVIVKERSGATVTTQEAERIKMELPNPGTGVADGDDPVTFKAKMDRAVESLTLGIARARYLRANGFKGNAWDQSGISIDGMRGRINARAKQIEQQVTQQNPGMAKPMIDQQVNAAIKREFGI